MRKKKEHPKKKPYSVDIKKKAIESVISKKKSVLDMAEIVGCGPTTIRRWCMIIRNMAMPFLQRMELITYINIRHRMEKCILDKQFKTLIQDGTMATSIH